ncbi:MAG: hypothetical protein JWO62_233 [Acidimicrobiaceae bacterium]|jgi:hypothetical protein|nr:hypothetical protein [Acidimicrobiaceae bacterium]
MTLLLLSIPLMLAVIAAVLAPLVFAIRHEHHLKLAELSEMATPASTVRFSTWPHAA